MLCFMIFLVSLLVPMIQAIPLTLRDVYDPPITSPNAQTVWSVGESRTVTWDISSLPANLTKLGMVVLGFQANNSENLMLDHPLATNFKLTDAQVQITVPNVPTRKDYIIVLFGDSGNASPQFTIQAVSSSTTTSTTINTATSTTTTISLSESTTDIPPTTASPVASSPTATSPLTTTPQSIPTSTITPASTIVLTTSLPASTGTKPSSQASTSDARKMQSLHLLVHCVIGITFLILWDFF